MSLEQWDADRAAIAREVRARVLAGIAARGEPIQPLVVHATQTMAAGAGEEIVRKSRDRGADWRALAARAAGGADAALLAEVVDHFVADIAGGFHDRIYRAVTTFLRGALGVVFAPGLGGVRAPDARLEVAGPIDELHALSRQATLVFAPTHTSNLDSLVLGVALRRSGFPPCAYAAAKHMYRNRVFAAGMGRVGAYRVDRGLPLELYKDVLKEYSTVLLERGHHSVIFPGGTRCRSGEIDPVLKLGLLGTAALANRTRQVRVVPVTINYQVVLEAESLIHYELTGRARERIVGDEVFRRGRLARSAKKLWQLEQIANLQLGAALDPGQDTDTRWLAGALRDAFQRGTRFMTTHVAARAAFDLARPRMSAAELHAAVAGTLSLIRRQPERGSLHWTCEASPEDIVATAVRVWSSCHARPPLQATPDGYAVADPDMLLYYRNRTIHLAT